ncbi:50S ribosomal protein L20 [bacterium (Candidatus Torokbacteria) CG_4_10_14_0_2_um_filter_35_8]|nr:MAG: 50S ribosomal protein L20 [bacterium (Candidatus Torokbacteria) CG_4_10_14_0_2_um_filter_35_8]
MRVKRHKHAVKKRKKLLKQVKGYLSGRSSRYKLAKEAFLRARTYSYRDRKKRKGDFRKIWILRINSALKKYNISYSLFINYLSKKKILLNRKMLAEIAVLHPVVFKKIVEKVQISNKNKSSDEAK